MGIKSKSLKDIIKKEERRGWKATSKEERMNIWNFWHNNTESSTLTSRPAKIREDMVPKIQGDLEFHSGVKLVTNKRNIKILVSPWLLINKTIRALHTKYKSEFSCNISLGTFMSLRLFYIRSPTPKDIEMCDCKDHLHARWAINALLKLTKIQKINTTFDSYETFFSGVLYSPTCKLSDDAAEYIKWKCTQSKKSLCTDILTNEGKDDVTVKMLHFVRKQEKTRKGKIVKRLKAVPVQVNISWVMNFIGNMLPTIVHHRNLLKNFRTNIDIVTNSIQKVAEIGLDFSENITIPVNKEAQSFHWGGCKEERTIHSLDCQGLMDTFLMISPMTRHLSRL